MRKKYLQQLSKLLTGIMCATVVFGNGTVSYADTAGFITETAKDGYAISGITDSVIQEGGVVIPDEIDGVKVTQLGSSSQAFTFLGRNNISELYIGKNVKAVSSYAFYGAKNLQSIEVDPENKILFVSDDTLHTKSVLIKYLSTSPKDDYKIPDGITRVFNMDYTSFGTLDLNQVTTLEKLSLAGSEIDTLILSDHPSINGSHDILYGAIISEFDTTGSSVYTTDGKALQQGKRLIKIAQGADFREGYFEQFDSISPYAFNSIAEYNSLKDLLPERLTQNVVFSFFVHDEGVFMVNNEIGFCYNYNLKVPDTVGESTDYSPDIDSEKYEQIKALMYVGVPFDGIGLFESTFGMSYKELMADPSLTIHGDAALNSVSAIVYRIIDSKSPAEIKGIGYGPFTEQRVAAYLEHLQAAVDNYTTYNFVPNFALEGNTISFHAQDDGTYVSDAFTIDTIDGNGEVNNSYIYLVNIGSPDITVDGTGETVFQTGAPVILRSSSKPSQISLSYNEPALKYYKRTSDNVQNILASTTRQGTLKLNIELSVDDLVISKQDITTQKELPGAELILKRGERVIDTWTSSDVPHIIKNPEDGEYTLIERIAPDGYRIAEEIVFHIVNGKVEDGKVVMYDEPLQPSISISKKDITTNEELPGAKLKLTKDGKLIDEWVSSSTPYIIEGLEDGDYTLTELTAPDGYEIAESIQFKVSGGSVEEGMVVMYDAPSTGSFSISKTDASTGKELPGAHLILMRDNHVIDDWYSTDIPHIISDAEDGHYILTEITAPNGYEIAETIEFFVLNGKVVGGPIIMMDIPKKAPPVATPSEPDPLPSTPSDAIPSTPSDATPSEPDSPKDSHGSGGSSGSSSKSSGGPGYSKPAVPISDIPKETPVIEPLPLEAPLPKTGVIAVSSIISFSSFITALFLALKQKLLEMSKE